MAAALTQHRLRLHATVELIDEVLASALSEEHRAKLIAEAVRQSGGEQVPERGEELARFVVGPLRQLLEARLGGTAADSLLGQFRLVAEHADLLSDDPFETIVDSSVRPVDRSHRELGVVLITPDLEAFSRLSRRLPPTAIVLRHPRLPVELRAPVDEPVIVIDAREGLPEPTALSRATGGRDVVVWGADLHPDTTLAILFGAARSWVRCGSEVMPDDLAALCETLAMASATAG